MDGRVVLVGGEKRKNNRRGGRAEGAEGKYDNTSKRVLWNISHTPVACYHTHCSIAYLACVPIRVVL